MRKEDFTAAFALGFLVTKEGFNAECPYPHLAPTWSDVPKSWPEANLAQMTRALSEMPEFLALRDAAFDMQSRVHRWQDFIDASSDARTLLIPKGQA